MDEEDALQHGLGARLPVVERVAQSQHFGSGFFGALIVEEQQRMVMIEAAPFCFRS